MKRLNCFIASAFGKTDVDVTYDSVLIPLLETQLNIKLNRVDRINHNKEITTKIIELIEQADFGIIDLTYARPSVYYEAGYLQGLGKPVIYIVRDDHFRRKSSDKSGNKIVHFDLSVKNIIPWTRLQNDLISRVRLVTEPLVNKLQDEQEVLDIMYEFEMLPLHERIFAIQERVIEYLHSYNFEKVNLGAFFMDIYQSTGVRAFVRCNDTLTQKSITDYTREAMHFMRSDNFTGICVGIFCSISQVPRSRIEKALKFYTRADSYYYSNEGTTFFLHPITSIQKLDQMLESAHIPVYSNLPTPSKISK